MNETKKYLVTYGKNCGFEFNGKQYGFDRLVDIDSGKLFWADMCVCLS